MRKKDDSTLLMDRRFLMDFLTEESPEAESPPAEPVVQDAVSREEMAGYERKYHSFPGSTGITFTKVCQKVSTEISKSDFRTWADTGIRLLSQSPDAGPVVVCFLESSPTVLASGSFGYFKGWVDNGEKISRYCRQTAAAFYRFTPMFLSRCDVYHIQKWANWGVEILRRMPEGDVSGPLFFEKSVEHLETMAFRELKEWKSLCVAFSKASPDLGRRLLSHGAQGLALLNWPERNLLYRLTLSLIKTNGETALEFFVQAPGVLADASPNTRDTILSIVEKLSCERPGHIPKNFSLLMDSQKGLAYPAREILLIHADRLANLSTDLAKAFLKNAPRLLAAVPGDFIGPFVDYGAAQYMAGDRQKGEQYFSLGTEDARRQIQKWANAVRFEDYGQILTIFAEALTGHKLGVQQVNIENTDGPDDPRLFPRTDGKTIFLPPFVAGGKTAGENFGYYRIATAHQAGYLEFGAFHGGIDRIIGILDQFPEKALALDIFFVLEDGRIDWLLGHRYRGMRNSLAQVVKHGLARRNPPPMLPLWSAMIEMLLMATLKNFDEGGKKENTDRLSAHAEFIDRSVSGFYTPETTVGHCYAKAVEIYSYITKFPNDDRHVTEKWRGLQEINGGHPVYRRMPPMAFRGRMVDLPEAEPLLLEVNKVEEGEDPGGAPLSPEELRRLLEQMADPLETLKAVEKKQKSGSGVYLRDPDKINFKPEAANDENFSDPVLNSKIPAEPSAAAIDGPFYYDEWDHLQQAYRRKWCRLSEKNVQEVASPFIDDIYKRHAGLIWRVKKQFQQIRPQVLEVVPRVEYGDEIDLPAAVQVIVDKKSGAQPSEKIFIRKEKKLRKIAVLFLVDMSASTGNPASSLAEEENDPPNSSAMTITGKTDEKTIMDIQIESLVVIMEALEALNDEYAIYGFSGYGRKRVDFYRIKDFNDAYSDTLKRRVGGIAPKQSTRMGPAIRHAVGKLASVETEQRLLILLSDGFPQDSDYGEDRTSHEYGLHDTMMALLEAENTGIRPFCITVDHGGNDYLKKMSNPGNYLVIQDIFALPEVLPKVVESLIE